MNNEFNQHKKSDFIKWIITFTALILLSISVIALAANVFGGNNNDTTTETEQTTENNQPTTAEGVNTVKVVNSDLMMLSAMAYSAEPAEAGAKSTTGVKVTATVLPEGTNQALNWEITYVDPNNEWAEGVQADATDFVYIESENEDNTIIYVKAYSAFGAQIKITATSAVNPDVSTYILVDYKQKLTANQYLGVDSNDFFVASPYSATQNYVKGIPYLSASELANLYNTGIELDTAFTDGTIANENVTVEYAVRTSEAFLEALIAQGVAAKNSDFTYLGDQNTGITAALLINTLVNGSVIPDADGTANNDLIQKFNAAAASLGSAKAFDISVQVITDNEAVNYNFEFYFDSTAFPAYPESIEFNVTNIVL